MTRESSRSWIPFGIGPVLDVDQGSSGDDFRVNDY